MKKRIMTLMTGMLLLLTACGQTGDRSASTMLPVAAVQSAAQAIAPVEDKVQEDTESLSAEETVEETDPVEASETVWVVPEAVDAPADVPAEEASGTQEEYAFSPADVDAAVDNEFASLTEHEDEDLWPTAIGDEDLDKELASLSKLLRSSEKPVTLRARFAETYPSAR